MMKSKSLFVVFVCCLFGSFSVAIAAPTVMYVGANAGGITGLDVNGDLYNVDFRYDTWANIWAAPDQPLSIGFPGYAKDVAQAISAVFNAELATPPLVQDGASTASYASVPYAVDGWGWAPEISGGVWSATTAQKSTTDPVMYAVFDYRGPAPLIPAPSALVLTATGVVSLVGAWRRRCWL